MRALFIIFGLFIGGCNANQSFIDPLMPEFESMSFDAVQKQLVLEPELPDHIQYLLSQWFDQKVKIDGFDGDVKFIISDFNQEIAFMDNGKRVDVSISFKVILNKPSLSQTKIFESKISSYGTITGDFSLREFDTVIQNTQSDLVLRLSRDLKSKI